jgi:hypothetical protein
MGYLTGLTDRPNDGVNLVSDESFAGYTTTSALHLATDGTLQMPGLAYQPTAHGDIAQSPGMWAGVAAAATNNTRVTIKLSRFRASTTGGDWWDSKGEWAFHFRVTSPRAATLYGVTEPIHNMNLDDGASPMHTVKKSTNIYPNSVMFDQIVPPGETQLSLYLQVKELDWFPAYYTLYEPGGSSESYGTFTTTVSATGNSTVTLSNSYLQVDLQTTVRNVY